MRKIKKKGGRGGEIDNELLDLRLTGKGGDGVQAGALALLLPPAPGMRAPAITPCLGIAVGPSRVCYCPLMRETQNCNFFGSFYFFEKLKDSFPMQPGPWRC